ncbi:LOW QUALITY PROTEIN: protein SUPPRESSOR OF npr1-1, CONSTITUTIVE 1 [Populus alba]
MASSSAVARKRKYDVFLSFRGEDTRNNFTSHLYEAMRRKKIKTFIDDGLERGEEITPALLKTIEESRASVVIFSKNYASSPWCVDELVKILECKETYGQIVLPVFYHVDPSDVDEQTGSFGNAFAELEKNFKGKMDKVPRWRTALTNAASISGWDSQVTRPESGLVDQIVHHILKKLNYASSSDLKGLVGMDSRMKQIESLLCTQLPEVCFVGIWGMGGTGKTTIAGAIFNKIAREYEGHYFLANVREESEKNGGLFRMRDELFSKITEEENLHIRTPRIGHPLFKDRICRKKILIVFDDVNDVDQIEMLLGGCDFGPGSRIILTSRDKQVLKKYADKIFEVEELNYREALHLFSLHAFKDNQLPKNYMDLSVRAINYAKGNPLALKVLGSFLCGRTTKEWESALNKDEKLTRQKVHSVLRISYEALDSEEKSIFLDIACFFRGHRVDFVKRILDGCGFKTEIGFSVLIDRCLIKISDDKVEMHDLLQEMAHEVVRKESLDELGRQSRLWNPKDAYQVLTNNLGTGKVEGIFLDVSKIREIELSSTAFARMYSLRLLKIYNSKAGVKCRVHLPLGLESLSEELRYLHWDGYPSTSLPCNFRPQNLVELNLSSSKVEQLWSEDQDLVNLKDVNLSNCEHITSLPDLSKARDLERLNLQFCTSLVKVPSSIQHLDKLNDLDLRGCTNLNNLPSRINSRCLKSLNLSGCSNLKKCPEIARKLTYLNLNETAVEELPQSIGELNGLVTLNLKNCKLLVNLPENIYLLKSLLIVDISGCSSISRFPDFSKNIRYLYLNGTAIEELPSSIARLRELIYLDLGGCNRLKNLPSAVSKLGCLEKLDLSGCSSITEFPKVSRNIRELYLDGTAIREIPSSIECLCELAELHLRNCKQFEILPSSICKLRNLQRLNLSGCIQFGDFPEVLEPMNCLRYLYLEQTRITKLPSPIGNLKGLACLEVGNCKFLTGITCLRDLQLPGRCVDLDCLRKLNLDGCNIREVPNSLGLLSSLEVLDLSGNNFYTIPISINKLFELQYLGLRNCKNLQSLPELPPQLSKLDADNCKGLNYLESSSSTVVEGNIFEFIFTNCLRLPVVNQILEYSLLKFQLYTKRLYHQLPDVPEGACSFCLPGYATPEWFSHQSWGSIVTFQLSSHWANSEFLGFSLCTVIAFHSISHSLQVKCTYHFRNEHGDSHDLYCYLYGWYDEKRIDSAHIFMGFDPCLVAKEDYMFSEYNEVSVEFQLEDINGNLLPLDLCQVHECGVRLLYEDEKHRFDLIMPGYYRFNPLDHDGLEAMFQAKRARFHGTRLEDYYVTRRTYELLEDHQEEHGVLARARSFCLLGDVTPEWFSHQSWGSTVTFLLSSRWANSEFLGFSLCAVIAFRSVNRSLQVKCTYHFRNKHGDSHDLYCYLDGWSNEKRIDSAHIFVGFDPCLVAKEVFMFSEYSEVSVEFQLEDINGNLLPLDLCQVHECGVRLLYEYDQHRFDLIMPGYYRFNPLDQDGLEAMFQAKRARFHSMRWEDYYVMRRTYEFLADHQEEHGVLARACSFCLPGDVTPEWFSHQSWGSTVTFLLSSRWANSKFLGFSLCAVIAFRSVDHSLQVKCTYHFRNKHGDSHDLYCYLDGWCDDRSINSNHIFVGFDPCLVAKEVFMFSEYSEVSVEFQPEDMNGNLLLIDLCQVYECGVRVLYEDEKHRFDLIMPGNFQIYPMDRDRLEAMFQAKRARFQGMTWEDYSVMRRTYKFLADCQEEPGVLARACSFYLPGYVTPEWFSHQSWGSTVTFLLSSHWANSKFLGFSLCAVIAFRSVNRSLQVKCTYHFRNKHGDSHDLYCYLDGWSDEKRIDSAHIFVGFDPCLVAKEDYMFSEYNEVSVEFQLEDINGNLLPLYLCQVHECGVRLLYEDEKHRFDLIMPGYYRFNPLDHDGLEAMFQAKRARFHGMRWEDYYVMRRTYKFLVDHQEEHDVLARASSFCLPGDVTPEWFSHQSWGSTVTFLLSSHWDYSKFLGLSLCAVIAFRSVDQSLQVKCTYHFRNKYGDSHNLYCYLHGWCDDRSINSNHIFVGFVPVWLPKKFLCLVNSEVSVEFQPEDMDGNLLLIDLCQVYECGVRVLYEDEKHRFDLIMPGNFQIYPMVRDRLEAMFQAKRARFQGMRWEDYSVVRRTYEFLADCQEEPGVLARACSFCLPGDVTPEWFSHQSWGSTVTFLLSSHWANSKFLGISLCAVIAFRSVSHSLQVKCTYHFRNKHGDSHDLYCYLHGWCDDRSINSNHIFVGFDPCLVAKEKNRFGKYSEVSIKFYLVDMKDNLLPTDCCQVVECGVRLLHANDGLEAMFQAKRARMLNMR